MRKCPFCDTYTAHDSPTCSNCLAIDFGWQETLKSPRRLQDSQKADSKKDSHTANTKYKQFVQTSLFDRLTTMAPIAVRVRVGLSAGSGKYGFELHNVKKLRKENSAPIEIKVDLKSLGHAWEYGVVCDPDTDVYLPPNLPLCSLIDAGRFVHVVENSVSGVTFSLVLPPQRHAATTFIQETSIFSVVRSVEYDNGLYETSHAGSSDDVLIPLTAVNSKANSQLDIQFHQRFNRLAEAGRIQPNFRQKIRKLIMEAAENNDNWGGGGFVTAFLRQEGRGQRGFQKQNHYDPIRDTHLFIHTFSLKGTLGKTLGCREIEAIDAIRDGASTRENGVGLGMPYIISSVTQEALGTVLINSGGFTRIISPDGINRDFFSAGNDYLPGVHLCAVIPLACVADVAQALSANSF